MIQKLFLGEYAKSFLAKCVVKHLVSIRDKKWARGNEFLINEGNVFRKQELPAQTIITEKKIKRCTNCHQPLGIISTMLYEIEEKLYCSECYSHMISNNAVERDHSDLMQAKEA